MLTDNKLGIWMDHSDAHLIAYKNKPNPIEVISNPFNHEEMEDALQKSEHLMHNKRQQKADAYYNKIGVEILNYEEVLLFGPTNAKTELLNILKSKLKFNKIKFLILPADQMTKNQKLSFVNEYFSIS